MKSQQRSTAGRRVNDWSAWKVGVVVLFLTYNACLLIEVLRQGAHVWRIEEALTEFSRP